MQEKLHAAFRGTRNVTRSSPFWQKLAAFHLICSLRPAPDPKSARRNAWAADLRYGSGYAFGVDGPALLVDQLQRTDVHGLVVGGVVGWPVSGGELLQTGSAAA